MGRKPQAGKRRGPDVINCSQFYEIGKTGEANFIVGKIETSWHKTINKWLFGPHNVDYLMGKQKRPVKTRQTKYWKQLLMSLLVEITIKMDDWFIFRNETLEGNFMELSLRQFPLRYRNQAFNRYQTSLNSTGECKTHIEGRKKSMPVGNRSGLQLLITLSPWLVAFLEITNQNHSDNQAMPISIQSVPLSVDPAS